MKSFIGLLLISSIAGSVFASEVAGVNAEVITFPQIQDSYLKKIKKYEFDKVALLDIGLNKDEVRNLIGNPHFNEGVFFVKKWNYILDVNQPGSQDLLRCHLQIDFDRKKIIERLNWKEKKCEDLINSRKHDLVLSGLSDDVNQNASVFFKFNSSDFDEKREGLNTVLATARIIKKSKSRSIVVVEGFSDKLGKPDYNYKLSEKRASKVAKILVREGVDPKRIQIRANSQTDLYQKCSRSETKFDLIKCLAPNRRVNMIW